MSNPRNDSTRTLCIAAAWLTATIAVSLIGGCGGHTTKVDTTTTGQELQDLEAARNKGLLTEDEYQKKRKEIMKNK